MNEANLLQAVFTRATNFTALTSKLGNNGVLSRVPQPDEPEDDADFPYVVITIVDVRPWDTDDNDGGRAIVQLSVFYRGGSPKALAAIADEVYNAFHKYQLSIPGANTVDCLFRNRVTFDDPDGKTMQTAMDFVVTYDSI